MPNRRKLGPCITPEITLRARNALAVRAVAEISGKTDAAVVEWMLDQWLNGEGQAALKQAYDIDIRELQKPTNVVPIGDRRRAEE